MRYAQEEGKVDIINYLSTPRNSSVAPLLANEHGSARKLSGDGMSIKNKNQQIFYFQH